MIRIRAEISELLHHHGVAGVRAALQAAIELEHATIPPYLYALYSLNPGAPAATAEVAGILVTDTFMRIERPERPIEFGEAPAPGAAGGEPLTIGQFYRQIRVRLAELGQRAFTGRPGHQVTGTQLRGAVAVTGVDTACQAIDTIIEQGEGTADTPAEVAGADLAHYYRFAEIVNGRRLIPNPRADPAAAGGQWAYAGDLVRVDDAAVFAVPVNPATADYPAGSPARQACDAFNYTYTSLLRSLHAAVSGDPAELGRSSFPLMMILRDQAVAMMSGAAAGGTPVGPTFEWQPAPATAPSA